MLQKRKFFIMFLALIFVFGTVLAGCGGKTETTTEGNTTEEKPATETAKEEEKAPADDQELHLVIGDEPPGLDSGKTTDTISFLLLNNVMEGLMRLDDQNNPINGIAESHEISADGLTYTFNLRDAKWSDGSAVTAHDFEYAWKRALSPETASEYAYIMYAIKGSEAYNTGENADPNSVGVKALDDKTLQVELTAPAPYFLGLTAFATFLPVKEEFVTAQGDKYATEAENLLFNGPFVMTAWSHDQNVVIEKNNDYWDADTVKLEKITFDVVKELNTAVNLYENGDIDRIGLAREQILVYKDDPNFSTENELVVFYLQYNTANEVMNNPKIRQAFSAAINRQAYVDAVLNNGSTIALGFVPEGTPGLKGFFRDEAKAELVDNDPAYAKKMLEEGLAELGISALPEIHFLTSDSDGAKKGAEVMKEMWRQTLGIEVVLDMVPFKERLERTRQGNFNIVFSGWGADYNDPMTFLDLFVTDGGFNDAKYSNATFDELINFGKTSPDQAARMQKLIDAEEILINDLPIAPVYFRGSAYVTRPYVKGIVSHPFGADYDYKWAYIDGKNK
jgi:oligopeptide transport system substrate-binding protein